MHKKIRVLETIRQGKIGGGETHVLDLVEELDKELYEPVVLSFTDGPMVEKLTSMGVQTHVIRTEKPFDFTKWGEVKSLLRKEKIDIVHAHGTRANSNTFWAANRLGLPIIYTVHGWSFHADQRLLTKAYRTLGEKLLIQNSTQTVCVSVNNYQDGLEKFNMQRATIIKNGINLNRFNPANKHKDIRAGLGIAKDTILVGYIARITTQKDPFTLLKAIAKVPSDLNIKFLLVGDGDLKDAAVQLSHALGIQDKVIFSGFRQDVADILHALDIYCLPSLWEGLPIGLLEAMAMQKAVIATAIDGTKEVVEHLKDGFLIPSRQPDALAEALVTVATNKELRQRLASNARDKVKTYYNVQTMTRQVESLYDQVLSKKFLSAKTPATLH